LKTKNICFAFLLLLAVALSVACISVACTNNPDANGGEPYNPGTNEVQPQKLTLTIGAKEDLKSRLATDLENKAVVWSSDKPNIVSVDNSGMATALNFANTATGTGTAIVTAQVDGDDAAVFEITATMKGQVDMMDLPPLKDQFADYFLIGNIFNTSDLNSSGTAAISNARLTRHYNVLTAENDMKPAYYYWFGQNSMSFASADLFVNAAIGSGFKVVGHTLLWHSQIPQWQRDLGDPAKKDEALAAMKQFITQVVTHYKGKIYSWDVLNEAFPDGVSASANWRTAMRTTGDSQNPNPWFVAIGSDFVYEGFLAARLADPAAILYYNDYNLDTVGKATMVRNMVRDVNQRWQNSPDYDGRKLIEGIGMQSHHNINVSASAIKASLDLFKPLGVKISISELDVLSMSYNAYASQSTATNANKLQAANLYGEYMRLFIQYSDIIERVSFWGVYDEQSWRSGGLPLIFEGSNTSKAKPAYYKLVGSLQ
jgi:endo-1,4-beta-xylanase